MSIKKNCFRDISVKFYQDFVFKKYLGRWRKKEVFKIFSTLTLKWCEIYSPHIGKKKKDKELTCIEHNIITFTVLSIRAAERTLMECEPFLIQRCLVAIRVTYIELPCLAYSKILQQACIKDTRELIQSHTIEIN